MNGDQDTPDALRLTAVFDRFRQSGVLFKMRATDFVQDACHGIRLLGTMGSVIEEAKQVVGPLAL